MNYNKAELTTALKIPKNIIRVWVGPNEIPEIFNEWWQMFKDLHPDWNFIHVGNDHDLDIPDQIANVYNNAKTWAERSDLLRYVALYNYGGIYVDTDVMPLKPFDSLIEKDNRPFAGMRSKRSFESAIIGSPPRHPMLLELFDTVERWCEIKKDHDTSVRTGPGFLSKIWFGRWEVRHLPTQFFYPYDGFMAPKREEKEKMFKDASSFPNQMYCAHFSNRRWGGSPKLNKKSRWSK